MSLILSIAFVASSIPAFQDPEPVQEPAPQSPSLPWITDWEAAQKAAGEQNKDLLIDFTGSDWCTWCQRLTAEVFDQPEFVAEATQGFVFVELDFPNDRSGQSEALQAQNQRLLTQFEVEGYPTIVLADASGRPYAKTGYQKGGAGPYLEHLAELREIRTRRDDALAAGADQQGADKAKSVAAAIEAVDESLHGHYIDWIDQVIELDADNSAGLREKFDAKRRSILVAKKVAAVKASMQSAAAKDDWVGAAKILDDFLAGDDVTPEARHELTFFRAMVAMQAEDSALAIKKLEETLTIIPDHPMNERIRVMIERMAAENAGAEKKDAEQPSGEKKEDGGD